MHGTVPENDDGPWQNVPYVNRNDRDEANLNANHVSNDGPFCSVPVLREC